MGVANNITAVLNFVTFLCSIPIIAVGIWLAQQPDNGCIHLLRWPVVLLGFLVHLVSLAGFVAAYCNKETLLAFYLCCMAIVIGLLLILLVFAFIVTRPDGSYGVPGRGYQDFRLDGYSSWLTNHVVDSKSWTKIRACLADTDVCPKLTQQFITADQFFATHLSPLHSGCCKPPTICGYTFVNPTLWTNPVNPAGDLDCNQWSNDQTQLCYNCNSCKAGLLGNFKERKANIILIVEVVVLIWVYIIACSAFKNGQTEDLFFNRYKQGWT
ncbi:hypothetical protein ES319_A06G078400v1 [Gossypium barbadense]|uniref:Tetraspanin n=1 Tax=Gossypium barbadense TaxID=3634 RepID=A0A5J5VBD1_GOSBA|nr:hypothetical protein ES319_A06G078400v1 [Gossypium barbadense]